MALDSGATNVTSSADSGPSIVGGVGKVFGDAVIAFNKVNVIAPLVTQKLGVAGAKTVEFADWKVASYADVAAAVEGADTTVQQIDTTARTATLSEHVIQCNISDLAEQAYGAGGSIGGNAGAVIGNAIAARLDNDLAALFAPSNSFSFLYSSICFAIIFICLLSTLSLIDRYSSLSPASFHDFLSANDFIYNLLICLFFCRVWPIVQPLPLTLSSFRYIVSISILSLFSL